MKLEFRVKKLEEKSDNHENRLALIENTIIPNLKEIKDLINKKQDDLDKSKPNKSKFKIMKWIFFFIYLFSFFLYIK